MSGALLSKGDTHRNMATVARNHEIDPEPYAPIECPLCNAHGRVTLISTTGAKGREFLAHCTQCNREWSAIQPVSGETASVRGVTPPGLARLGLYD